MITEVKERRVSCKYYGAVIRDSKVVSITEIYRHPSKVVIEEYIAFLKEVLQAIKETE